MSDLKSLLRAYLEGDDDAILVTDHAQSLTRGEFRNKVNSYADRMAAAWSDVPADCRGIAIQLERTIDYLAVIFACWLVDGFYLPLNMASPKAASESQIRQSGVSILCSCESGSDPQFAPVGNSGEKPIRNVIRDDLAYVIFTSGSTGEKKGVAISKSSLMAYIDATRTVFDGRFRANAVVLNGELTFDITQADLAFALIFRTEICVTAQSSNLFSLCAIVKRRNVESIYAVPSTWEKILDLATRLDDFSLAGVKNVFSGGEALSSKLISRIRSACPSATIFNMYGPTEFTVNAYCCEVRDDMADGEPYNVPLGRPFPGVREYIESTQNADEGELYLAGAQIMAGYVNAEPPFVRKNDEIYYPTGDLVRRDAAGLIHYVGRLRDYEKISGYRINLLTIEEKIQSAVDESVKLLIVDGKILCVVQREKSDRDAAIRDAIRSFVSSMLESYEMPSKIVFVDGFPLNSNGKLDRQRILAMV